MLHALVIISLFQLAAPATASALVTNPTLGYGLTAGQLIRFTGIPGACQASPDPSGARYTELHTASAAPVTILVPASASLNLFYINGDTSLDVPLAEPALHTALSPTGNYFVTLSTTQLRLFNRSGPAIATAALSPIGIQPTDIADLLVSDQGEILLTGANTFWYSAKNAASFTPIPMALTFVRFMPHDHLIVAYDSEQGRVIAVHPASAFAVEPLLTSHDGLTGVTGLQFSADGYAVWVSQESGPLVRYGLPVRHSDSFTVPAGGLSSVLAPGVFIWDQPGTSYAILDTTQPTPAVLVVPTAASGMPQ
jgi:hypothetical protein